MVTRYISRHPGELSGRRNDLRMGPAADFLLVQYENISKKKSRSTSSIKCARDEGPSIYCIRQEMHPNYICIKLNKWSYLTEIFNKSLWNTTNDKLIGIPLLCVGLPLRSMSILWKHNSHLIVTSPQWSLGQSSAIFLGQSSAISRTMAFTFIIFGSTTI